MNFQISMANARGKKGDFFKKFIAENSSKGVPDNNILLACMEEPKKIKFSLRSFFLVFIYKFTVIYPFVFDISEFLFDY